ncbi:MAG: DNA recombination protein RmuC [Coxiella sp. (in: Bacteria)]|nr:MAG: DNA recombination protein RmuC [Coxiella sp. (in: g-proteobacteria)]
MIWELCAFIVIFVAAAGLLYIVQGWLKKQEREQNALRHQFDDHQLKSLKVTQDSLQQGMKDVRRQVTETIKLQSDQLGKNFDKLTQEVHSRLKEISGEVDKQLTKGFEKTTQTFTDVVKRLTIIDEAQKKISELSGNVISLKEILVDKKSRGAFGEVQLSSLIHNMIPETHFAMQHTLSNGKRPDCFLFLPAPTGNLAIDAKFPLETFHKLNQSGLSSHERTQLEARFRLDIKHHIKTISEKYIIANETADGAIMFLPAESIFAEIHAHYPDLIEAAHKAHVWLVSPTTLMAVLTTARAVLKDEATRRQVHIIQEHLLALGKDFDRFQKRMDNLSRHINQAHEDVELVHRSSQKISSRFIKIEKVELSDDDIADLAVLNEKN